LVGRHAGDAGQKESSVMEYLDYFAELLFGLLIAFAMYMVAAEHWPPEQTERDESTRRNWVPDDPE
jgi:hypothetical protein